MRKLFVAFAVVVLVGTVLPTPVSAALVNCGSTIADQCDLQDLFGLIVILINYLISIASIVAIYHIILAGWTMITALGNAEQIEKGKKIISEAVVGFAIVILAFVFINLLVNGIFGRADSQRNWWDINCIYNITNMMGCPLGGVGGPTQ